MCDLTPIASDKRKATSTCGQMFGNVQDLVDLHVFAGARKVVADLRQHDCTAALVWCEEHKGRLKKGKNKLEFRLRMQVSFCKMQTLQKFGRILCLVVETSWLTSVQACRSL